MRWGAYADDLPEMEALMKSAFDDFKDVRNFMVRLLARIEPTHRRHLILIIRHRTEYRCHSHRPHQLVQ